MSKIRDLWTRVSQREWKPERSNTAQSTPTTTFGSDIIKAVLNLPVSVTPDISTGPTDTSVKLDSPPYANVHFARLASMLRGSHKTTSKYLPEYNPTPSPDFATLYRLTGDTSVHGIALNALPQLTQFSESESNNIVFLRGQPCPQWLVHLGSIYRIDPTFFLNHLSFLSNLSSERLFAQPSFTSMLPARRFSYFTIGKFSAGSMSKDQDHLDQLRDIAKREMTVYVNDLNERINRSISPSASIVRAFHVLDEQHFVIEQQVSIYFQQTSEKGWTVIIWLDTGKPLIIDRPSLLTKALQDNMNTHEEIFLPWIREHSFISTQASILRTNQLVTQTEPGVSHPHLNYGKKLDKQAMAQDPFYALQELLTTSAYSISQFLNAIESKITEEEITKLAPCDKGSPANMIYFEELLDKYADVLRRNVAMIKTRDEWPQPTDPKIAKHTAAEAQALLRDFEYLLERTKRLSCACKRQLHIFTVSASVVASKKAIKEGQDLAILTRMTVYLAFPLLFVSSLLNMDFVNSTTPVSTLIIVFVGIATLNALVACASQIGPWVLQALKAIFFFFKIGPPRKVVESFLECGEELWVDGDRIPRKNIMLQPDAPALSAAFNLPQHDTSSSSFPEGVSSASVCASDETSDSTESSLDDADTDSIEDLANQKAQIVDHLIVYVYDMFALTDARKCKGGSNSGSSTSVHQGNAKAANGLPSYGPKRTSNSRGERNNGEDRDEQEDDDSGKRRKTARPSTDDCSEDNKRLACPYYKQDPHAHKSSKACAGPGWYKVHRLKEHLYREHAEPLHCRRCFAVFRNEEQLTEHSRSYEQCTVRDAKPMVGFNKNQEAKLKCRSTMFRAESEEHKWKIIFLILFPDTALSEIPSPYYDLDLDTVLGQAERGSPKPPELQQFDAYMKRELPRIIRKALEAKIEKLMGPIQETLKNDLENIVRDCQEDLTRNYMNTIQASNKHSQGMHNATDQQQQTPQGAATDSQPPDTALPNLIGADELAQYFVPPDAPFDPWLGMAQSSSSGCTQNTFSDSANFSLSTNAQNPFWDDIWLNSMSSNSMGDILTTSEPRDVRTNTTSYGDESIFQPRVTYTGKGKGKARDSGLDSDVDMDPI